MSSVQVVTHPDGTQVVTIDGHAAEPSEVNPIEYVVEWLQGALESGQAMQVIEERMAQSTMSEHPSETMLKALIDLASIHRS